MKIKYSYNGAGKTKMPLDNLKFFDRDLLCNRAILQVTKLCKICISVLIRAYC